MKTFFCRKGTSLSFLPETLVKGDLTKSEIVHLISINRARHVEAVRNMSREKISLVKFYREEPLPLKWTVRRELNNSDQRKEFLENLNSVFSLNNVKVSDPTFQYIRLVCDELLTNAFYNGPCMDVEGIDRKESLELNKEQSVEIVLNEDEYFYNVTVIDRYGSLTFDKYARALNRGMLEKSPVEKKGGAGLGMYMMFEVVQKTVITVSPRKSTSFSCSLAKSKKQKKLINWPFQFHFNQEG